MTPSRARLLLVSVLLAAPAAVPAADAPAKGCSPEGGFTFSDPAGDDDGPGTFTYPTDAVYKPGSFDVTELQVVSKGDQVEIRVTVKSRIEDPWDSAAWNGNGFSVQMAFVHVDTDHQKGSGVRQGLPGTNVRFAEDEGWDRVVIISPQGPTRVNSEIGLKAAQWKDRILVPKVTRAEGRTLVAVVDAASLGGAPRPSWGWQVLMQSNEGFPAGTDFLTRKVNEYEGQHRWGGGNDGDCDPHVMDVLEGPDAKQSEMLAYECAPDGKAKKMATLKMLKK